MNAVDLGLVSDGFTGWFVALVVAATALVWLTVGIVRAMERDGMDNAIADIAPRVCLLSSCDEPGWPQVTGMGRVVFVCRAHEHAVAEWMGDARPYDQEQDAS